MSTQKQNRKYTRRKKEKRTVRSRRLFVKSKFGGLNERTIINTQTDRESDEQIKRYYRHFFQRCNDDNNDDARTHAHTFRLQYHHKKRRKRKSEHHTLNSV